MVGNGKKYLQTDYAVGSKGGNEVSSVWKKSVKAFTEP